VWEPESPLSDDSYIMGFVCGVFAAAMGVVYTAAEKMFESRRGATMCYATVLVTWTLLLIALSMQGDEGAGVAELIAIGHSVSGVLSWFLFAFRVPRSIAAVISVCNLVFVAMYVVVVMRMASINSAITSKPADTMSFTGPPIVRLTVLVVV